MPELGNNEFFLGHHKSHEDPCGELVVECKHPNGAWVGIFQSTRRYSYGEYFVVTRRNRKQSIVQVAHPEKYAFTWDKYKVDDAFVEEWGYGWGFGDDLDAAHAYLAHVRSIKDHPRVPAPWPKRGHRDAQRQKLYDWETPFCKSPQMERDAVEPYLRNIEADFRWKIKRPVHLTMHKKGGCFQRGFTDVNLARYGWNTGTIIHEMAHWVNSNFNRRESAGHGPEFVGIYMLMLEYYKGECLTDMINAAVEQKLKFVFPKGGMTALLGRTEYIQEVA